MKFYTFILFAHGIANAEWEGHCPVYCQCPQREVVHCNEIKILDEDNPGQYKLLDHIPDDIPPETTHLELVKNNITRISDHALKNLPNLIYLNLGYNNIYKISPSAFDDLESLRVLWLDHNLLRSVPDDVFFENQDTLEQINLESNQLEFVQKFMFADLENLKQVFLQHNNINFIHPKAFKSNTEISRLFLHGNKLTSINTEWFDKLVALEELYLDDNPYECNCVIQEFIDWGNSDELMRALYQKMEGTLPECSSPPSLKGKVLYQIRSEESSLTCEAPTIFPKLSTKTVKKEKALNLACTAAGIPSPDITWIGPDGNELGADSEDKAQLYIPRMLQEDFGKYTCRAKNAKGNDEMVVTVIEDTGSYYDEHKSNYDEEDEQEDKYSDSDDDNYSDDDDYSQDYDREDVDDLLCPGECYCERQVIDCREADLKAVPSIEDLHEDPLKLDLKGNEINNIDANDFDGFDTLEELTIDDNTGLADKIDKTALVPLRELKFLSLANIRMMRIGSKFQSLDKLEKLILSENSIDKLERINFDGLTNLQRLFLDDNQIEQIDPNTFYSLHNLQYLHLQNNKIHTLMGDWFTSFTDPILVRVNLVGNDIECHCGTIGSFIHAIAEKPWLEEKVDMDGERCYGEDEIFSEQLQNLKASNCQNTVESDQQRDRVEHKQDDELEKFLLSDNFEFKEALDEKKKDEKDEKSGFDANHVFPDLPEDLRNVINLEDLQKVIKMELDEPELDYDPLSMNPKSPEDYKIDNYDNHQFYDPPKDAPIGDTNPPVVSKEPVIDSPKKSATSWVIFMFIFFAITFLVITFKRWRRWLLGWLLRCGDGNGIPQGSYNPNMYSTNRFYGQARSSSRETLI